MQRVYTRISLLVLPFTKVLITVRIMSIIKTNDLCCYSAISMFGSPLVQGKVN